MDIQKKLRVLYLHVKYKYFDEIKDGSKPFEYRLYNRSWCKALKDRVYDEVHIMAGYPKKTDSVRIIKKPWRGYEVQNITHEHFGPDEVKVFAIRVN